MWIRAQDKMVLINANIIDAKSNIRGDKWVIYADNTYTLGVYSTIEKVLETLDKLQTALAEYDLGVYSVFQMPQEEELDD